MSHPPLVDEPGQGSPIGARVRPESHRLRGARPSLPLPHSGVINAPRRTRRHPIQVHGDLAKGGDQGTSLLHAKEIWGLMGGFWNRKTPTFTFITGGIVDVGLFIAASGGSRFGYWPPAVLLVVGILAVVNNFRIDRVERERR